MTEVRSEHLAQTANGNSAVSPFSREPGKQETWPEPVPMDDAFIAVIAECRAAAQAIEAQARGALVLFMRQRGLTGAWRVAANGRELERAE